MYKHFLRYMYQLPIPQISDGSFSAVSKPIFASKYAFFSIFRALQDSQTFAPLHTQNFQIFWKISQNFVEFSRFLQNLPKYVLFRHYFHGIFSEFLGNPRKIPEIYKICRNFANFMKIRSKFPNFGTATTKNLGSCATTKFCS